jgi:hypothetical protein
MATNADYMSTYALVIDDLDDSSQPAGIGAVALEENHTADLDLLPGRSADF